MEKKVKNKFFDFALYKEGLKQLRLVSLIIIGLTCFVSLVTPIGTYLEMIEYNRTGIEIIHVPSSCSIINVAFVLAAPILTLNLFSFLTKRNACDYYHAFPQKRTCIFISYMASIITWIAILLVAATLCTCIPYLVLSDYFMFAYDIYFVMLLCTFVASLLTVTGIAFACTLTGTLFMNVVVSGIILFVPRILLSVIVGTITGFSDLFVYSKFLPFIDNNYNMLFNLMDSSQSFTLYSMFAPIIYTLVLSVIYFLAGCLIFSRRKSEVAGNAAASSKLQCVFRLCIGYLVCLPAMAAIFSTIVTEYGFDAVECFEIFILYIVAILAMLIFELMSTRKFKNVIKALPSVGILALLNVVTIFGQYFLFESQLNYTPEASQISYIIPSFDNSNYMLFEEYDYFETRIQKTKIYDEDFIEFVATQLNDSVKEVKTELDSYQGFSYFEDQSVTVGIKSGLNVVYRNIHLTEKEYEKYIELLETSDEVLDTYNKLPKYDGFSMNFELYPYDFSKSDAKEIYNTLRSEIPELNNNEWFELLTNSYSKDNFFRVSDILWTYTYNGKITSSQLPITSLTPKTAVKYIDTLNKKCNYEDLNTLIMLGTDKDISSSFTGYITINIHDVTNDRYYFGCNDYIDKDNKHELFEDIFNAIIANSKSPIESLEKDGYTLVTLSGQFSSGSYTVNNTSVSIPEYSDEMFIYGYIENELFESLTELLDDVYYEYYE